MPDMRPYDQEQVSTFDRLRVELDHQLRWRRRLCKVMTLGRHWYEEPEEVHMGPVGFEESEETHMGSFRMCRVCYHTEPQ